ncbi:hypothetical protein Droror1_Dr00009998 [Drosera rotundifolia]
MAGLSDPNPVGRPATPLHLIQSHASLRSLTHLVTAPHASNHLRTRALKRVIPSRHVPYTCSSSNLFICDPCNTKVFSLSSSWLNSIKKEILLAVEESRVLVRDFFAKMSSNDQNYKAGETKGHVEEKTGMMMDKGREAGEEAKERAGEAKDKTADTAYSAKDKTADMAQSAKEYAGEKKDQSGSYISETPKSAKEKAAEATKETAQAGKDKTGDILQRTGEQVRSMAEGAADAAKRTFGMGKTNEDDPARNTTNE